MEITDVRIKLVRNSSERLKAFCTITFDSEFVVRDIKIVEGMHGLFVAMPSRKVTVACPGCRHKNHLRSRFCEDCGERLPAQPPPQSDEGRTKLYTDVAHPITQAFREKLQTRVIDAFGAAIEEVEADRPAEQPVVDADEAPREESKPPVEADEPVETEPVSDSEQGDDYRSLIADLKGGPAQRDGSAAGTDDRPEGSGRRRQRGRGGRPRRPDAVDKPSEPKPDRSETAGESEAHPAAEVPATTVGFAPDTPEERSDEVTTRTQPPEPKKDLVSVDETTQDHATSDEDLEDSSVFGVGIG